MGNPKVVKFNPESREKLIKGVNILGDAVSVTLGPKGRNVIIDTYGVPSITKDGVTVAKWIDLEDKIENLGANVIKQAASKTADRAGDGTTTATVIAQALINYGHELIQAGFSPIDIKRTYEAMSDITIKEISDRSLPLTEDKMLDIATISANNDPELGELISSAYKEIGRDGVIIVEDSRTNSTYTSIKEGVNFDRGYTSPYFITDPTKMEVFYKNPLILITDKKIRTTNELVPIMEKCYALKRPLVVIADEIEAQALELMVINKLKSNIPMVAVRAPAYGTRRYEILQDLAILTSAEYVTDSKGMTLEAVTVDMLGTCNEITISQAETTMMGPNIDQERLTSRIQEVQAQLQIEKEPYILERLAERLAKLSAKVAVMYVGAATESEAKEKKDRIDDAIRAVRSSISKGYVAGAGQTLADIALSLSSSERSDIEVAFIGSIAAPASKIRENAGINGDLTIHYNALTGEPCNLIDSGIVDPALVVEEAVRNAVSAANMIILSEVTIYDTVPKYSPPSPQMYE